MVQINNDSTLILTLENSRGYFYSIEEEFTSVMKWLFILEKETKKKAINDKRIYILAGKMLHKLWSIYFGMNTYIHIKIIDLPCPL